MRCNFYGCNERAMKTVLENLKGFVLKSGGGDEDATKRPQANLDSSRGSDGTDASKADQHRQRA
jgi:hypothetical protein